MVISGDGRISLQPLFFALSSLWPSLSNLNKDGGLNCYIENTWEEVARSVKKNFSIKFLPWRNRRTFLFNFPTHPSWRIRDELHEARQNFHGASFSGRKAWWVSFSAYFPARLPIENAYLKIELGIILIKFIYFFGSILWCFIRLKSTHSRNLSGKMSNYTSLDGIKN